MSIVAIANPAPFTKEGSRKIKVTAVLTLLTPKTTSLPSKESNVPGSNRGGGGGARKLNNVTPLNTDTFTTTIIIVIVIVIVIVVVVVLIVIIIIIIHIINIITLAKSLFKNPTVTPKSLSK